MSSMESPQVAVIGFGGGGSTVVKELQDQLPLAAQYLTLDVDSEVFGELYYGYECDVVPPIQAWARTQGGNISHWFDLSSSFSPLRDIPDIFLRKTTRPVMKASLLMQRTKVESFLRKKLHSPNEVILTTQLTGATGSAWILEVATMLKELFPSASFRLIVSEGTQESYSARIPMHRALANSYWTLKEINADGLLSPETEVASSVAVATSRIRNILSKAIEVDERASCARVSDSLFDIAQEIRSSFHDHFACEIFMSSRASPLSELLGRDDWCALIGLLLAFVEDRVDRELGEDGDCWRSISYRSRLGESRETISVPASDSVAKGLMDLAHTHQGFGPEEHQRSHQILSEEGSAALAGRYARITEDAASRLAEMRSSIKQRIDEANNLGIGGSSRRYVIDLYPELLALTDQLMMKSGIRE